MDRDFRRIVEDYSDMLFRISLHYLSSRQDREDVVQQVFLKLVENQKPFQSREHEKAWLIRVCTNLCKDRLKSAYRRKVVTELDEKDAAREEKLSEQPLLPYIRQLPGKQKTAIYLFYYEDRSVAEIGRLMGAGQNTVLSWLSRGRKALKKMLKEDI